MIRAILAVLVLCLASAGMARAQCPTSANNTPAFSAGGSVFGAVASQWNQYFGSKVDANGGVACNLTLGGSALFGNNLTVGGAFTAQGPVAFTDVGSGVQVGCLGLTAIGALSMTNSPCPPTTRFRSQITMTSSGAVTAATTGGDFNNLGSAGVVTFTLPPWGAGLNYCFTNTSSIMEVVQAQSGAFIAAAGASTASGGTASSAQQYSMLCVIATTPTIWQIDRRIGNWVLM